MRTLEELDLELCNYCPLPDEAKGTHGAPNGYYSCEGSNCKEAYEAYQDECTETCIGCGAKLHPDEAECILKAADDEYGPLCQKCYKEAGG